MRFSALLAFFVISSAYAVTGQAPSSPAPFDSLTSVSWKATPLLKLGDAAPDTGGTFLEFGDTWWIEGTGNLVFIGRHDSAKTTLVGGHRAAYSLKDGRVRSVSVPAADGRKVAMDMTGASATPLYAGSKLLYFARTLAGSTRGEAVWGWDGEQSVRIVGVGDSVPVSGGRNVVIRFLTLRGVTNRGEALIEIQGERPSDVTTWMLHDGTGLKPFLTAGDSIPGLAGVTVKAVLAPPTFFDDASLAIVSVNGAPYKSALLRLTAGGAEKLLAEGEPNPAQPNRKTAKIAAVYAADSSHFVVGLEPRTLNAVDVSRFIPGDVVVFKDSPQGLIGFNAGRWGTLFLDAVDLPGGRRYGSVHVVDVVSLAPHSSRFALSISQTSVDSQGLQRQPGLYVFDEGKFAPLTDLDNDARSAMKMNRVLNHVRIVHPTGFDAPAVAVPSFGGILLAAAAAGKSQFVTPEGKLMDAKSISAGGKTYPLSDVINIRADRLLLGVHEPNLSGFVELAK